MIVLESIIMLVSYIYKEAKPKPPEEPRNRLTFCFKSAFIRVCDF